MMLPNVAINATQPKAQGMLLSFRYLIPQACPGGLVLLQGMACWLERGRVCHTPKLFPDFLGRFPFALLFWTIAVARRQQGDDDDEAIDTCHGD